MGERWWSTITTALRKLPLSVVSGQHLECSVIYMKQLECPVFHGIIRSINILVLYARDPNISLFTL
jgi:hypothetical protein